MISKTRPRRLWVLEEAPTTATDRGHSNLPISGTTARLSAQAEPARDDAAQDLGGAALDGELGGNHGGEGKLLPERGAVHGLRFEEGSKVAHAAGKFLLPDRAEVFDDRAFDHRLFAGVQHAGDRHRHA